MDNWMGRILTDTDIDNDIISYASTVTNVAFSSLSSSASSSNMTYQKTRSVQSTWIDRVTSFWHFLLSSSADASMYYFLPFVGGYLQISMYDEYNIASSIFALNLWHYNMILN